MVYAKVVEITSKNKVTRKNVGVTDNAENTITRAEVRETWRAHT